MKGIKNVDYIHDLAGIKTIDGLAIKPHLLYRSANLSSLSEEEVDFLADELNVKHVIDLRTSDELEYKPEAFISRKIEYHHIPLLSNELNPVVTKENRIQVLNDLINGQGGMRGHLLEIYRTLFDSELAINGYKQIFKLLLESNQNDGFLYHCTQGKDRTGMVILLLLSVLGVAKEKITKVYLSFNDRARLKRTAYFLGMNIRFFSMKKAIALNDTLTARIPYIQTAYDTLNKVFGGVDNYIRKIIGLTDDNINQLKLKFLA